MRLEVGTLSCLWIMTLPSASLSIREAYARAPSNGFRLKPKQTNGFIVERKPLGAVA